MVMVIQAQEECKFSVFLAASVSNWVGAPAAAAAAAAVVPFKSNARSDLMLHQLQFGEKKRSTQIDRNKTHACCAAWLVSRLARYSSVHPASHGRVAALLTSKKNHAEQIRTV